MLNINSVYHGDCLKVMKEIEDKSIDMILADLPYEKTKLKWDVVIPFEPLWKQYKRIIKNRGAIVLFGIEPFSSALRLSNIKMYKYDWIWGKNNASGFALARKQPMRNHEIISILYNKQPIYNYIKEERVMSDSSKKRMGYAFNSVKGVNQLQGIKKVKYIPEDKRLSYPKTIQFFKGVSNNSKERIHPTQKPVALFEYLIKTYTNEGDLVLDNVAGSGTTAIACINTKRNYILIEKKQKYINAINQRIKAQK